MTSKDKKIYKIDAKDMVLGRLASKIAILLQGKDKSSFEPNRIEKSFIEINNLSKIKFSGNKLVNKKYFRHSGYPGGLKSISLSTWFKKNPEVVFRGVVFNMLPKNRNRKKLVNRLKLFK